MGKALATRDDAYGREWALLEFLLKSGVVRTRRGVWTIRPGAFSGSDAVRAWLQAGLVRTSEEGIVDGSSLSMLGLIRPVNGSKDFENKERKYYLHPGRIMDELRCNKGKMVQSLLMDDVGLLKIVIDAKLIGTHRWNLRRYEQTFIGSEAVKHWVALGAVRSTDEAVIAGRRLLKHGLIRHVRDRHQFKNATLYYQIVDYEEKEDDDEQERFSLSKIASHFTRGRGDSMDDTELLHTSIVRKINDMAKLNLEAEPKDVKIPFFEDKSVPFFDEPSFVKYRSHVQLVRKESLVVSI